MKDIDKKRINIMLWNDYLFHYNRLALYGKNKQKSLDTNEIDKGFLYEWRIKNESDNHKKFKDFCLEAWWIEEKSEAKDTMVEYQGGIERMKQIIKRIIKIKSVPKEIELLYNKDPKKIVSKRLFYFENYSNPSIDYS